MRQFGGRNLYSATDLCNFAGCSYLTHLDLIDLVNPLPRAEEDPQMQLVIRKGEEHERRYLEALRSAGREVVEVPLMRGVDPKEALAATTAVLKQGPEYVYQAFLYLEPLNGYADFLKRVDRPSSLGNFSYEVIDTKLSKTEKASYLIQLCFYSELLQAIQGQLPDRAHIVTGEMQLKSFTVTDYYSYYQRLKRDLFESIASQSADTLYAEPCAKCSTCAWRNLCKDRWERDDHLSLVATITRSQRLKLERSGITTCTQLIDPSTPQPATMHPDIFLRLRDQARLQKAAQVSATPTYRVIPPQEGGRGFALLPEKNEGDIFYDIEGDPLLKAETLANSTSLLRDGLEYLHGFSWREQSGTFGFRAFWALTKQEERRCFEDLMDFITERVTRYPNATIYHYSPYEIAALKRLSSQYPTRIKELDNLLRGKKFCDLYTIVKQSVRVSEPRYSIKNLERFYSSQRDHQVKDGGQSIVWFEEYLETKRTELLEAIRDYNRKDCDSMIELYDWLVRLKAESAKEFNIDWNSLKKEPPRRESNKEPDSEPSKAAQEELRVAEFARIFAIDELQATRDPTTYTESERLKERLFYLSDFYRREMKPAWWNHFRRRELLPMERADDPEVITGCLVDPTRPSGKIARSRLLYYTFPTQECKLSAGDSLYDIENDRWYGEVYEIDTQAGTLTVKLGPSIEAGDSVDLSRRPHDPSGPLKTGLDRFLNAAGAFDLSTIRACNRSYPYAALIDILLQDPPVFADGPHPAVVAASADDPSFREKLTDAALKLERSYLFIQGPPGTGKTYHGARLAVSLMMAGKRLAMMSNSHKAIINFLEEVDVVAAKENFTFRGAKKSNKGEESQSYTHCRSLKPHLSQIADYFDHKEIDPSDFNLIAGTAWTLCREEHDQSFDYLIVDEASQLSLAHLCAAGVCATNIILIGDPQQLPQPLQGIHPAQLDCSPLEYLLGDHSTVPPERGVFLDTCRRMHTEICDLLSTHVYDSRLTSPPENGEQRVLPKNTFSLEQHAGYLFYPCDHDGNTQNAPEEVSYVRRLYDELLTCSFRNKLGEISPITPADIMVIAPYNMQVELLRRAIPGGEVGTIDLFQGREAPVVIVSMTASSMEETPRGIEFLFSRQRLNVALSRAKALAIVVGSPKLFQVRCTRPEQIRLVNFFCALAG